MVLVKPVPPFVSKFIGSATGAVAALIGQRCQCHRIGVEVVMGSLRSSTIMILDNGRRTVIDTVSTTLCLGVFEFALANLRPVSPLRVSVGADFQLTL